MNGHGEKTGVGEGGRSSFASDQRDIRRQRADKILAVLEERCPIGDCRALDIGTGSGMIARRLGEFFREVVSVDVTDQRVEKEGYRFEKIEDERLPFADESFEVVISNQVIEHVWDAERHVAEMARVMTPSGIGYLATPNRFALIEPHYRLPFLSWLPARWAGVYLRLARGKQWDVRPFSFRGLRELLQSHFVCHDVAPQVCADPVRYRLMGAGWKARLVASLPSALWSGRCNPVLPSFLLVVEKRCTGDKTHREMDDTHAK